MIQKMDFQQLKLCHFVMMFSHIQKALENDNAVEHRLKGMTHDGFNHLIHSENTHLRAKGVMTATWIISPSFFQHSSISLCFLPRFPPSFFYTGCWEQLNGNIIHLSLTNTRQIGVKYFFDFFIQNKIRFCGKNSSRKLANLIPICLDFYLFATQF